MKALELAVLLLLPPQLLIDTPMIFLRKQLTLSSLVFLLFCSANTLAMASAKEKQAEGQLGHTSSPLDLSIRSDSKVVNEAYLDFYGLLPGNLKQDVKYFSGLSNIDKFSVSSHVFVPKAPVGTIFILHGYFDHVGTLRHMINFALENNYAVFTYDLPGHGSSSGNRGDIGGFNSNALLLNQIVDKHSDSLPKPYQLIGFSTGGSIALENIRNNSKFEKTVLVSPLIRHKQWRLGKFGYAVSAPFLKTLKSHNKKNSSNVQYLEFAKNDPLRGTVIAFDFLRDLYQWNRDFNKSSTVESDILVVQGELDKVVEWRYNIPLLQQKTTSLEVYKVPEGKHQLFNEVEAVRNDVFEKIITYLKN